MCDITNSKKIYWKYFFGFFPHFLTNEVVISISILEKKWLKKQKKISIMSLDTLYE